MNPACTAAAAVTFMSAWNAYLWPLAVLQSPSQLTMPLDTSSCMGGYVLDCGVILLTVTIAANLTPALFFALLRSFVKGIPGSVK